MAFIAQSGKTIQDLNDCIAELKRHFYETKVPIDDDNVTLHRFEEKIESLLLLGLKDKPGLLGAKKSYWDYICACFSHSKRSHEGIKFVKSLSELKTSLGKGRAFIRFCLMQKCLADTLQACLMSEKITRDYYPEKSFHAQKKLWSPFLTSVYDLNDLNFDLTARHMELDVSWPSFARKHFVAHENNTLLDRKHSSSSLFSFSSQNESILYGDGSDAASLQEKDDDTLSVSVARVESIAKLKSSCNILFENKLSWKKRKHLRRSASDCCLFGVGNEYSKEKVRKYSSLSDVSFVSPNVCVSTLCFADHEENKRREISNDVHFMSESCVSSKHASTNQSFIASNCDESNIVAARSLFPETTYNALLEMKKLIDSVPSFLKESNLSSYFSHLKTVRNSLENALLCDFYHFNENKSSSEKKYISLETFASHQCMIISRLLEKINSSLDSNKNLHANMLKLYNLLRSYGFLKMYDERKSNVISSLTDIDLSFENFCNSLYPETSSNDSSCSILNTFKDSLSKLSDLNAKINELQIGLDSTTELNNNLISKVQAHGLHLRGITREIEEAQHLVSVLKEQHKKLQSTEGILKYDLQEKRKLLTVLKKQLETTREDWNLVRIKNSKSEVEWKNLRKEFVLRHKQTSEESGFDDDKSIDEQNNLRTNSLIEISSVEENDKVLLPDCDSKNLFDPPTKKSRLEILEEQCQLLYSNLLQGSKKREDIDNRLEAMCKTIGKTETTCDSNCFSSLNHCEDVDEALVDSSGEEISEDIIDSDNFTNSPVFSSNIGSLNSDSSSFIASVSVRGIEKSEDFPIDKCSSALDCIEGYKSKHPSPEEINLESDTDNEVLCAFDQESYIPLSEAAYSSTNLLLSDTENNNLEDLSKSLTEVDSLIIRKKDLEKSIKHLKIQDRDLNSDENSVSLASPDFQEHIISLEQEKSILQQKVEELEKKVLIISTELDNTSQQLLLIKASRENEVAALQFQLNTEALKYERALKEFREQNAGLENMKQKVTDQEQLILALEEALTEIRTERENEREHQWEELQDLQTSLESRDEECTALCEDLEKSIAHIEEERSKNDLLLAQLEDLKSYNERDKITLESEIIHLQNDSRQLQKRVVKLLKEKDMLWKKSDQLAFMQKAKISDRWMNNHETNSCLGCKSYFSFMLRKHHCRHCGRIFCYSCSNNWLFSASSSKQVRVCNECYKLYLEMKNDAQRGSDVPQIEDDSEDEARIQDVFFNPVCSSSFNSDEQLSIAESIVSLPVREIINPQKRTPIFASAPDLQYVLTQDAATTQNGYKLVTFPFRRQHSIPPSKCA
ncbi:FYVE and coiled-coil domain-containing protein 1-like [Uloborus diversus]|uniref:FYVE and coiled-coil domain-containing protein 1-like n=1 Tax=Uloborus diversus TaxID=327109 RepID=UPI00240A30B3|nr:FYVE and coiled-coil domain-containing protein 1-like [Uloborus diversus]